MRVQQHWYGQHDLAFHAMFQEQDTGKNCGKSNLQVNCLYGMACHFCCMHHGTVSSAPEYRGLHSLKHKKNIGGEKKKETAKTFTRPKFRTANSASCRCDNNNNYYFFAWHYNNNTMHTVLFSPTVLQLSKGACLLK